MTTTHRIYLVGAHSTGKTTLARWIKNRYEIPMISEVARSVLAEMEAQLGALRTDMRLVNEYQMAVFERQIAAEASQTGSFVSDRAFCNLAYAAQHATVLQTIFQDPRLQAYMDSVRQGVVFYLRPHQTLLADDGVREDMDWEEVLRIDGMVKLLLELFAVPYIPVASLAMQERIRLVSKVLQLAGLPLPESTRESHGWDREIVPAAPPAERATGNGRKADAAIAN
jgi:nicotinamide riboside kinase